jgi:hypothetical protein
MWFILLQFLHASAEDGRLWKLLKLLPLNGAKGAMAIDSTMYLVLSHFLGGGEYFAERDRAECTREATIRDLCTGEIAEPKQVYRVDLDHRSCADESEDFARECWQRLATNGGKLSRGMARFLENQLGIAEVAHLQQRMRSL